jgi:hypothetical protein
MVLRSPEIIARTAAAAREQDSTVADEDVRAAIQQFDSLWDQLFPAEQARIIQLLIERVDLSPEGAKIRIRSKGLSSLAAELPIISRREAA